MVQVFREVRRVLRDDGVLWLNYGDCYSAAGWECNRRSVVGAGSLDPADRKSGKVPGQRAGNLMLMPHRVAIALQDDGWIVRNDLVWCLSGGATVYAKTQKGEMPMMVRDLVRLDPTTVKLWNGANWTQVLGFSETPRPDRPLEIVLKSGERIGCTPNHEWPTERGLLRTDKLVPGDVIQKTLLPEPQFPVEPKHIPDSFGWVVGIYLAEGSRSGNTLQIAGHIDEDDRWNRLKEWAKAFGGTARLYQTSGAGMTMHVDAHPMKAAIDLYIAGKTAKNKHLTTAAWQRTDDFLEQVLRGYLDGDGHYDVPNDRYRLGFTNNDYLAQDLRTLAARLDVHLRLIRCKHTMGGRKFPGWRGTLRFQVSQHFNARKDNEVAAIENSRARKFYDIGVADEPHLFALASGILTHNSKRNPMPESVAGWRYENDKLRKSSWRHTRAHEYVFMLTKGMGYYCNQEAVREASSGWNGSSFNSDYDQSVYDGLGQGERIERPGRNPRSVLDVPTAPYKGSHYATFPPKLIAPLIRASVPRRCCPVCGMAWAPVVERTNMVIARSDRQAKSGNRTDPSGTMVEPAHSNVTAYRPTCDCCQICDHYNLLHGDKPCPNPYDPVPGRVLDIFGGSGTTGMVAKSLLRRWVVMDISRPYLDEQAKVRTGSGSPANALDGLPMFEEA